MITKHFHSSNCKTAIKLIKKNSHFIYETIQINYFSFNNISSYNPLIKKKKRRNLNIKPHQKQINFYRNHRCTVSKKTVSVKAFFYFVVY